MYKYKYFFLFLFFRIIFLSSQKELNGGAGLFLFRLPLSTNSCAHTLAPSIHLLALAYTLALAYALSVSIVGSANTRSMTDRDDVLKWAAVLWAVRWSRGPGARVERGRGLAWRRGRSPVLLIGQFLLLKGTRGGREGGEGSCVPAHTVRALQRQGLGLVGRGRAGGAAEGRAVGGRGVTRRVRVLTVEL